MLACLWYFRTVMPASQFMLKSQASRHFNLAHLAKYIIKEECLGSYLFTLIFYSLFSYFRLDLYLLPLIMITCIPFRLEPAMSHYLWNVSHALNLILFLLVTISFSPPSDLESQKKEAYICCQYLLIPFPCKLAMHLSCPKLIAYRTRIPYLKDFQNVFIGLVMLI